MRKNRLPRLCAAMLAILLLTALMLCACDQADETDASASASADVSGTVSNASNDVAPEVVDLDGMELNVFSWDFTGPTIHGYSGEILYSEEEDASAVDVAKKEIAERVESDYHCEINGSFANGITLPTFVSEMVTSSTYDFNVIFADSINLSKMVTNGTLTDLNSVGTFHFENSWWDQNAVEQLSIGNKLFYVNGDINTYDDLGTWCVLFNKSLKERLGIEEDFYQTVRDGDWTLDHFRELCESYDATRDINGDGTIDEKDQWAFGTETYNVFVEIVGGGLRMISKDENDLPYITVEENPEQFYSALDKIIGFYSTDNVMIANYGRFGNTWDTINKAFLEQRELFYMGGLFNLVDFRDMEDDIGVLPIPKTFADQDSYYHTVSVYNSSYLAIPLGVPDVENLGLVLEALAMGSQELVTPAFYDRQLKYRDVRDNESGEMLDIIFSTRLFDLGPIYNWGDLMSVCYTIDTNYASRFDALLEQAKAAMEQGILDMQS